MFFWNIFSKKQAPQEPATPPETPAARLLKHLIELDEARAISWSGNGRVWKEIVSKDMASGDSNGAIDGKTQYFEIRFDFKGYNDSYSYQRPKFSLRSKTLRVTREPDIPFTLDQETVEHDREIQWYFEKLWDRAWAAALARTKKDLEEEKQIAKREDEQKQQQKISEANLRAQRFLEPEEQHEDTE